MNFSSVLRFLVYPNALLILAVWMGYDLRLCVKKRTPRPRLDGNERKRQKRNLKRNKDKTKIIKQGLLLSSTWKEIQIEARFVNGAIWTELYCHLARVALQFFGKQFAAVSSHDGGGIVWAIIDLEIIVQTLAVAFNIERNKAYSNPEVLYRPKTVPKE